MLLAKLRYAVLGVATLALVSTGVGVVAQTMPGARVSTDRLKAVEQKLDRLLEVLGGSRTPARTAGPFLPGRTLTGNPGAAAVSTTITAAPSATAPAIARGLSSSRSSSSSTGSQTLARGDVVGRVDRLEHKLNELDAGLAILNGGSVRAMRGPSRLLRRHCHQVHPSRERVIRSSHLVRR